jgi:hypothetical protein
VRVRNTGAVVASGQRNKSRGMPAEESLSKKSVASSRGTADRHREESRRACGTRRRGGWQFVLRQFTRRTTHRGLADSTIRVGRSPTGRTDHPLPCGVCHWPRCRLRGGSLALLAREKPPVGDCSKSWGSHSPPDLFGGQIRRRSRSVLSIREPMQVSDGGCASLSPALAWRTASFKYS